MIKQIDISNFKSIDFLKLDLGLFNVFIGENGSGKSNILEAIAFGGAASANKLDSEFFSSRGIRYTTPAMMENRFPSESTKLSGISVNFVFGNNSKESFNLNFDTEKSNWIDSPRINSQKLVASILRNIIAGNDDPNVNEILNTSDAHNLKEIAENLKKVIKENRVNNLETDKYIDSMLEIAYKFQINDSISNFLIYSPENSFLRQFQSESQINPLGIKGEGVFRLLKEFSADENKSLLNQLKENLHLIDWFDDFDIKDNSFGEKEIRIKDRYLDGELVINQSNANEGFLFLMFYLLLYISPNTPSFFAIDNLEASFHPKLCTELIKVLVDIAKKNSKQSLITTHNPFILDGLDLNDNDQRLFVVRRNSDGATFADRIEKPIAGVKLSEAWMRGYIGGNPQIA